MASKLGYLIGMTRLLPVEEAVSLVERLAKGPTVGSVTDTDGAYRYLTKLPGIRHMRFAGAGSKRVVASMGFEPLPLTATPLDEGILQRILHESPGELCYRINVLRSDKKPRGGFNGFWDADGSRLSIHHVDAEEEISISVGPSFGPAGHRSIASWRELLDRAGLGDGKVLLTESGPGDVIAEFDPSLPFERRNAENATLNQLLIDADTFSKEPGVTSGKLTGLTLFGRGCAGDPKTKNLWERVKRTWETWRAALPAKHEFWEISVNSPIDRWETCRSWINANLPGPFVGCVGWGTATADVAGILRSEAEAGQYVELCWKRVRGRITIVSGIREPEGWRIQLSGVDQLNEAKAAATREAFLKLAGRDDLFVA